MCVWGRKGPFALVQLTLNTARFFFDSLTFQKWRRPIIAPCGVLPHRWQWWHSLDSFRCYCTANPRIEGKNPSFVICSFLSLSFASSSTLWLCHARRSTTLHAGHPKFLGMVHSFHSQPALLIIRHHKTHTHTKKHRRKEKRFDTFPRKTKSPHFNPTLLYLGLTLRPGTYESICFFLKLGNWRKYNQKRKEFFSHNLLVFIQGYFKCRLYPDESRLSIIKHCE
jgi:hypothetical protein